MHTKQILFLVVYLSASLLRAQTMKTVPGMYGTIAGAVAAASAGDTISIAAGTYSEQLRIQKNLTFIGAGQDVTMIHDAAGSPDSAALFIDNATVTLRDIQFLGGMATDGGRRGVVAVNSTTTIRRCAFVACFNVSIADVNGTLDIDSVVITSYNNFGAVVVDSAGPTQSVSGGYDLGVMLVNTQCSISHLTAGARIDHLIDIYPDMHGNTMLGGEYPVDTTRCTQGTIENSTFFGSRQGYYGQGIRIGGSMTRLPANLIIRYNRFKGTVTDSTLAVPDMPTTAGISFNGYNGYAQIYNNTITQFNTGIAFHGIATAMIHDNIITGNARYGVATTDQVYPVTPPDLGGGAFGSPGRNTIMNNGHYNVWNRNGLVHWATGNYWGTTDAAAIDALVYDHGENTAMGIVHVDNYQSSSNPLPVELLSFTAERAAGGRVVLHWNTATEVNNAGFDVERTTIGAGGNGAVSQTPGLVCGSGVTDQLWCTLGFVSGAGTSNAPRTYAFADADPPWGRCAYRLKQIDRDGKFSYSPVVETGAGALPSVFNLGQNYPNPFNPTTTMSFTVPEDGHASLQVYTTLGQRAAAVFDGQVPAGRRTTVTFDATGLPSGVYFARLEFGGRQLMKKITLMK